MKRIVSIATSCLLLLAVAFSLASCATWDGVKEDVKDLFQEEPEANAISLVASEPVYFEATESSPAYVEKTITAVVVPANAIDQDLIWELYWENNTLGEDAKLADYVAIEADAEDSHILHVRCFKAFGDAVIGIRATVKDSDVTATCSVTFVGEPAELNIFTASALDTVDNNGIGMLRLGSGQTYTFECSLSNIFGEVGEIYGNYELAVEVGGACTFNGVHYIAKLDSNYIVLVNPGDSTYPVKTIGNYTFADGVLTVQILVDPSSISGFTGYNGYMPYISFTITETVSGLSQEFSVVTCPKAEAVELGDLQF